MIKDKRLFSEIFFIFLFFLPSLSHAEKTRFELFYGSLYDSIIKNAIVSINAPELYLPAPDLPQASSMTPIDYRIKLLARKDSFAIYPDKSTQLSQKRFNLTRKPRLTFFQKYRNVFKDYTPESLTKIENYIIDNKAGLYKWTGTVVDNKGALDALDTLQRYGDAVKCLREGRGPEDCALDLALNKAASIGFGQVITYLGLGSAGTLLALAKADYDAAINIAKLHNEVTGLVETRVLSEKQKLDRMKLGLNLCEMTSYLELQLVRYENRQNYLGQMLVQFWEDAESNKINLEKTVNELVEKWKALSRESSPGEIQIACEKGTEIEGNCNELASLYTVLTQIPFPSSTGERSSFNAMEFQSLLQNRFTENCTARVDLKLDKFNKALSPLFWAIHNTFNDLQLWHLKAFELEAAYQNAKKKGLLKNKRLYDHFEQQLRERFGTDSERYKDGMTVLDRFRNQTRDYHPQFLKDNLKYVQKRLGILKGDVAFYKHRLKDILDGDINQYLRKMIEAEGKFLKTAKSKAKEITEKLEKCLEDKNLSQADKASNKALNLKFATIQAQFRQTAQSVDQINRQCNTVQQTLEGAMIQVRQIKSELESIAAEFQKANVAKNTLDNARESAQTIHDEIKTKTINLFERTHNLEKRALQICQKMKELNDHTKTDAMHRQNYQWLRNQDSELMRILTELQQIVETNKTLWENQKNSFNTIKSQDTRDPKRLQEMIDRVIGTINTNKTAVQSLLASISLLQGRTHNINAFTTSTLGQIGALTEEINALPRTSETSDLKQRVGALTQKANAIQAPTCSDGLAEKQSRLMNEIDIQGLKAAELQRQIKLDSDTIKKTHERIAFLIEGMEASFLLSKTYFKRAANAIKTGAAPCLKLAHDLIKMPFVPNVVGADFEAAKAQIAAKGLIAVEGQKKPSASQADSLKVFSQKPSHTTRRKINSRVVLNHYQKYVDLRKEQEKLDRYCNSITAQLQSARERGDINTYKSLLAKYKQCDHFDEAVSFLNQMQQQLDNYCNSITAQLQSARQRGDINTYKSLLAKYKQCDHYDEAVSFLNQMQQQLNNYCNSITAQLQSARERGDINTYKSLLAKYKQCDHYDEAVSLLHQMEQVIQPEPPPRTEKCDSKTKQGRNTPETIQVNLGNGGGAFSVKYNMIDIKDRMVVSLNGRHLWDTGCVSGSKSKIFQAPPYINSVVTVRVIPRCDGKDNTKWYLTVTCPK